MSKNTIYLVLTILLINLSCTDWYNTNDTENPSDPNNTEEITPCPGLETVDYSGLVYHTVQIGDQCWLRENINIGIMLMSNQSQTNNNVIEKYCAKTLESTRRICDFVNPGE